MFIWYRKTDQMSCEYLISITIWGFLLCRLSSWCFLQNIVGHVGAGVCFLECLNQTTRKIRNQQLRNLDVCTGGPSQVSCENIPIDVRVFREPMSKLSVPARPSCGSNHGLSCGRTPILYRWSYNLKPFAPYREPRSWPAVFVSLLQRGLKLNSGSVIFSLIRFAVNMGTFLPLSTSSALRMLSYLAGLNIELYARICG